MREELQAILHIPHHISSKRLPMSLHDRACQFVPFAALTGFDAQIDETARLTDTFHELTEDEQDALNHALCKLIASESKRPFVTVRYFQPDGRKSGGEHLSYSGNFRFYDELERKLKFVDGMVLDVRNICKVEVEKYTNEN